MGYTTDFTGEFAVTPTLKPEHAAYIRAFADVRHMQRDPVKTEALADPVRIAVGLPVGKDGEYYVGGEESWDTTELARIGIINSNRQGSTQPGLWCQWTANDAGDAIHWDGGEKFYYYTEWLEYLITNFFKPWGYKLNGKVKWQGEERSDKGYLYLCNNKVYVNEQPTVLDRIVQAVEKNDDDGAQQDQRTGAQRGEGVVRKRRKPGGTGRKA